jgi:NAD(P)H-hydrate epimerase
MKKVRIGSSILKKIYKKRDPWSHKFYFGHLLVIGGSKHYSGSPIFNALAALRSGVDLVTIAAPERAANIIASFAPDLIAYSLKGDYLNKKHLPEILKLTKAKTAVVIGGGLCREKKILDVVNAYLKKINLPCVMDADAIHAVARNKKVIGSNILLTPHSYEFYILSGKKISTNVKERTSAVKKLASKLGTTILLKGHIDIISDGKKVALNRTGSPYLTKGGMGDTLAGICGALLARGVDTFTAACASAYINGRAGEIASKKLKESVTATDLINAIPKVVTNL